MHQVKVIFFDLFFTLINPKYLNGLNEYDVLGMTKDVWESYAENEEIYIKRATGMVRNEKEIIDDISRLIPSEVSEDSKKEILRLRRLRMQHAMTNIDFNILESLKLLNNTGIRFCLISNADLIDAKYWKVSEISNFFDSAIFSYEVGYLKPDSNIYHIAMKEMNCTPEESLFIGDGGSEELYAAKELGIRTILSEYLEVKPEDKRKQIVKYADYCITSFSEIIDIINSINNCKLHQ